jgi:hypothetical protein
MPSLAVEPNNRTQAMAAMAADASFSVLLAKTMNFLAADRKPSGSDRR